MPVYASAHVWSKFSLSTLWVLGVKLILFALTAIAFHRPSIKKKNKKQLPFIDLQFKNKKQKNPKKPEQFTGILLSTGTLLTKSPPELLTVSASLTIHHLSPPLLSWLPNPAATAPDLRSWLLGVHVSELASAGVTAPNSVLGVGTSCQNWCQDPQFLRYMGSFTLQPSRSLSSQGGWGSSSALASALCRSSPPLLLSVIIALAAASNSSSVSSGHAAVPLTFPLPVTSSAQFASDEV